MKTITDTNKLTTTTKRGQGLNDWLNYINRIETWWKSFVLKIKGDGEGDRYQSQVLNFRWEDLPKVLQFVTVPQRSQPCLFWDHHLLSVKMIQPLNSLDLQRRENLQSWPWWCTNENYQIHPCQIRCTVGVSIQIHNFKFVPSYYFFLTNTILFIFLRRCNFQRKRQMLWYNPKRWKSLWIQLKMWCKVLCFVVKMLLFQLGGWWFMQPAYLLLYLCM